jgi:hypothetical protein
MYIINGQRETIKRNEKKKLAAVIIDDGTAE